MDYPEGFPKHLQPPVDNAIHNAEVEFIETKDFAGHRFFEYDAILDWIEAIFWVFADQACQAGLEEVWTGQEIRNALEEYLNRLASSAQLEKSYGIDLSRIESYVRHVKESSKWLALQRKLADVATSRIWALSGVTAEAIPVLGTRDTGCARTAQVEAFLKMCNRVSAPRIYKNHIWKSVGHSSARQFEYWQSCDEKATTEDERNFARILAMKPEDFIAQLKQRKLIEDKL